MSAALASRDSGDWGECALDWVRGRVRAGENHPPSRDLRTDPPSAEPESNIIGSHTSSETKWSLGICTLPPGADISDPMKTRLRALLVIAVVKGQKGCHLANRNYHAPACALLTPVMEPTTTEKRSVHSLLSSRLCISSPKLR